MSCPSTIPSPPTTLTACALPVGGSNTTILDTCCNSHVNAMSTYSAPGSSSNAKSDNGCFQFCVTDDPDFVAGCLTNTLGEFGNGELGFECFNTETGKGKAKKEDRGYGSAAVKTNVGWMTRMVVIFGVLGAVVGSL